jgi:hypothetical protein
MGDGAAARVITISFPDGSPLPALTRSGPTLIVFLRHFG